MTTSVDAGTPEAVIRRGPIWVALGAFWVLGAALYVIAELSILDAILLSLMLAVMPGLSFAQVTALREMAFDRHAAYVSSIATLWVLGATAWLVGTRNGGAAAVGLVTLPVGALLGWTVALTTGGLAVMALFRWVGGSLGVPETGVLARLLPRTPRERRLFAVLSVTAGFGEELAYRGYLIPVLATAVGLPWSVALSTVVFGLLHTYQGPIGVIRTTIVGAMMAGGFLASGSLLPVIAAHAAVDLLGGLVLADWLLREPRRNKAVGR